MTTAKNTPVLMPKLGQAMTEGTVQQWHRKTGDRIQQGEILVTIETDKATYDIEAPTSGTLHITVPEGLEVRVGTVIGEIGDAPAQAQNATPVSPVPSGTTLSPKTAGRTKILASPKAKQLAAEHGIDLATVTAAGADGIIAVADVQKVLTAKKSAPASSPPVETGRAVRERRTLTGIRKTTARRTQEAWQTIPHIVQMVDVDATALLAARTHLKNEIPSLTLNDLILYAAAQALIGLPDLNGTVEGDTLILYEGVDVGFAVDTPRGLLVPTIRNANTLSVKEVAAESQRLIEAARTGRLTPENIGNASLTVSNLGMFGIRFGTPVINLGEPILVFVGSVEERPVVVNGQVTVRSMMTLSIGYDHRVTDGVGAARFTQGLKEKLESFKFRVPSSNSQPLAPSIQPLEKRELRTTSAGNTYTVEVQSHGHIWTLDEPTADGGTDIGPDPVTAFLGALLSCMTISFKAAARRRQITIERIEGRVQANSPGHVKNITMSLVVWSPDPEEKVRVLLDAAKRGCYVSGVLKPEIETKVELAVVSS
jgi:pyruvate dehydrogenase E2 component (dihydrolipoamide acetyltransferase)